MTTPPTPVTAVVLHYSGIELTLDCLASLHACGWPALQICVVDNASADDGGRAVEAAFPGVHVITADANLGYAGGNNLGIAAALAGPAEAVLILNNDTLVEPGAIGALVAALEPGVGAVAPLLTFADDPTVIWSTGGDFNAAKVRHGRMGGYRQPTAAAGPARDTERFTGAAVLVRREVLEQVGPFDDGLYFLYEDVDLSLRIREAGWRIRFTPDAVVRHRVAMTQGGEHSPTSFYYGTRNQLLVADAHAPAGPLKRAARVVGVTALHAARARRAPDRVGALRATARGARDYCAGVTGPRPAR